MDWLRFIRAGGAALFIALLGAGLTMRPDHPDFASVLFVLAALLATGTIIIATIQHANFVRVRDELGQRLEEGRGLMYRAVDVPDVPAWKAEIKSWFDRTEGLIDYELSRADLALFKDTASGPVVFYGGTPDYENAMNFLRRHLETLNKILTRYLEQRP